MRSMRKCQVEVQISFNKRLRIIQCQVHRLCRFLHGQDVFISGSHCSESSNRWLENFSDFQQIVNAGFITSPNQHIEGVAHNIGCAVGNKCPPAGLNYNQAALS